MNKIDDLYNYSRKIGFYRNAIKMSNLRANLTAVYVPGPYRAARVSKRS